MLPGLFSPKQRSGWELPTRRVLPVPDTVEGWGSGLRLELVGRSAMG